MKSDFLKKMGDIPARIIGSFLDVTGPIGLALVFCLPIAAAVGGAMLGASLGGASLAASILLGAGGAYIAGGLTFIGIWGRMRLPGSGPAEGYREITKQFLGGSLRVANKVVPVKSAFKYIFNSEARKQYQQEMVVYKAEKKRLREEYNKAKSKGVHRSALYNERYAIKSLKRPKI